VARIPALVPRRDSRRSSAGAVVDFDHGRAERTGAPEVILAEGKRTDHLVQIVRALHAEGRGALISRPSVVQARALLRWARSEHLGLGGSSDGRILHLTGPLGPSPGPGLVALVTAGTADVPIAEEAQVVLHAMGVRTVVAHDVGVAGVHRLLRAVRRLERRKPTVYLAFAGREGALPTVLAGLVRAPVVGVPTSIGYGRGAHGEGALTAMLQSCAPIAVVNVDGGVPAALFALQLLAGASRTPSGRVASLF
jgi:NCAIR mutase (PurE)-related protein